ncbi:UNVERIFIED_CONTAM: hypothetical protein K2H54_062047 [Gekko kuhli]
MGGVKCVSEKAVSNRKFPRGPVMAIWTNPEKAGADSNSCLGRGYIVVGLVSVETGCGGSPVVEADGASTGGAWALPSDAADEAVGTLLAQVIKDEGRHGSARLQPLRRSMGSNGTLSGSHPSEMAQ